MPKVELEEADVVVVATGLVDEESAALLKPGNSAVWDPTVKNLFTHSSCVNSSLE